jgi:hypothetical protein
MSTLLWGMLLGLALAALLALLLVWSWESEWAQKMSEEQVPQDWLQVDSRLAMERSLQRIQETSKEAAK